MLVLGDGMADWLAYGLEDAYAEQPDMGVIRKHKTVSGLIKYQPKGDPADWAAAAKGILATEKPDAIVVMLGLNDRVAMREPAAEKSDSKPADKKTDKKDARAKTGCQAGGRKTAAKPDDADAAKPDDKTVDTELPPDDAADNATRRRPSRRKRARARRTASIEFREERWVELYTKKIEEMIGVLKSKGVPVLWVGLPAVRGAKATADMLFLDSLYRDAAGKAGITYVDVWDGFVDEAGRFLQKGPDFEGQIRAACAPMTACISPSPARASSRIMSSAKSRGCWRRAPRRSRCRPNRQRPTPMRCPASRRRVRWPDRSCRWWHLPSAPINCSAAPARVPPRSTRSPRERWSRANRWRRPPAAPMILPGRAARSDANRPRAKRRWLSVAPDGTAQPPAHAAEAEEDSPGSIGHAVAAGLLRLRQPHRRQPPAAAAACRPAGVPRPPANVGRSASVPGFFTR